MVRPSVLAAAALSVTLAAAQARPVIEADGTIVAEGIGRVRLQGVDASGAELAAHLRRLIADAEIDVRVDGKQDGHAIAIVRRKGEAASLNEVLLARGVGFYRTTTKSVGEHGALAAATERARRAGLGVWRGVRRCAGAPPLQRGASLGLYFKVDRDYHLQLDRIAKIGADWVQLLLTVFVDRVDSSTIERDPKRTVSDARLRETIRYALKSGLRVSLLPVLLIRNADNDDDWRGTLRPADPGKFWRSYDSLLCRYLDIAREEKVDMFSVGSELCSLEKHWDVWPRLIQNARGRYAGWLTYSVNWDHYQVPRFWHLLDQVGMTGYFELTEDKNARLAQLTAAWRRVRKEIEQVSKRLDRPIVLTELGYASQDGANTAPWNYLLATGDIDLREQADCFEAFAQVMADATFLHGVYVYGSFEQGGPKDHTYAVWDKPAREVVERLLKDFRR